MKLQYVRAIIVLLAGLITLIVNMKTGKDVTLSLLIVLIVILIFYVIGTLVVEILQKAMDESNDESNAENDEVNSEDIEGNNAEEQEESVSFSFDEDAE